MEFKKVIEKRRSVRSYTEDEIPKKDIEEIIRIGHTAPSAGNRQARDFIVVEDEKEKRRLVENAYGQSFIGDAPWVIVVCAHKKRSAERYGDRGRELYSIQDATAAVENILLALVDMGYSSCWIGAFDEDKVSKQLEIPDGVRPIAILPIGHPAGMPRKPEKMNAEELTHHGSW
ncbi:MAG: nitroreductase family protein [Candidatus Thermoplasmatota archaeon]|nr:nitroreductase family protein [Candidatus Thermoplasmatota archaeon]MBS3790819.1 nitroreductase family protein [Candidatus Thermoplasmatota archaeon]